MDNNKKNNKLGPVEIVILIIAAFGLIIMISDISEAIDETKRERAEQDRWYYEHIQKGADEYNRNHPSGTSTYNSNTSTKNKKSSTSGTTSTKTTSGSYTSSKNKTSTTKKNSTSTKTVDPMDHDIDTYYEDYKDEFEDEDDAWDDFEDNDEYWDDY